MNGMVQSYNSAMQNNLEAVNKLVEAEARAKEVEQASDVVISQAIEGKLAREEAEKEALVNKENAIKMVERDLKMDSEARTSEAFTAKFRVAEEKMSLFEDANDQFMYLSQAWANPQLIKALEDGRSLATEKKQVEEWLKDFADAEVNLVRLTSELKEELKAPAPEPAPLSPRGNRSVETLADKVGVTDQSGSYLPAVGILLIEQLE
ncbi:hypothetical protein ISN44_Un111g000060 [Arabidopsis suecica]|uniref:Uncharacterized protein n=1 Tax=Arabidopsis suecica TaxID=45249 RepID=A0A8T1XH85_ARASU|nr:hypothetical protein ISN44_Un111g000060 [Arabidopsis suecica]